MPTRPASTHVRAGRLAPLAAATLLLAASLTGCAPDPTPPAPSTTAPTAATPTPTASLPAPAPSPTRGTSMGKDDEAGAVAAVDYFLALYAYTESTQDTASWRVISHPDCVFCTSVLDDVATQRAHGRITRAHPMVVTSREVKNLNPLAYEVAVTVTKEPDELWSTSGDLVDAGSDLGGGLDVIVVYQIDQWIVRAVSTSDPVTR